MSVAARQSTLARSSKADVSGILNWQWLRFSGIGRVPFDGMLSIHTALDEFRQDQLTFPPFTPNRLVTQHYFNRGPEGQFHEQPPVRLVHRTTRGHSAKNLNRHVADFSQSAVFVWFSSNSAANRQGSVMAYTAFGGHVTAWYAAFRFDRAWRLGRVKGISICEAAAYVAGTHQKQIVFEQID